MDEGARTGGLVEAATKELEAMEEGEGVRWEPLGVDMEVEVGHCPLDDHLCVLNSGHGMGFGGGSAWGGGASPGQFHGWCPQFDQLFEPTVDGEKRLKPFQEDQDRAMGPILLQHLGATEEAMVEDPVVLEVINKHFVQLKPFAKYFDILLKT